MNRTRTLADKIGFPLFLGACLFVGWGRWSAAEERATQERIDKAVMQQASFDARRMAEVYGDRDVSNCSVRDYGYNTVEIDRDPRHAQQVLWTRLTCSEGTLTIRGRMPRLITGQ